MRKGRWAAIFAVPAVVAMVVTGCGGGSSSSGEEGIIKASGTEPENPLVPGNTNESGGHKIIDALFTGAVAYSPDDYSPYLANAESITPADNNTKFTIKLKPGWTFHDGTPVKASNYVNAWNWVAYGPNGAGDATFLKNIKGYEDVSGGDNGQQPKAKEMSGLKVIDDQTFEVTLTSPFSIFPDTLGYEPFMPLPDSFFKDPKAFEAHPIGNGPFKFESREPNANVKLRRYDPYKGQDKPSIKGVDFVFYSELEGAYQDLMSGNLDFIEQVPPSALVGEKWKADLGKRAVGAKTPLNITIAFPQYVPQFNNPDLHKAISMAINRPEIAKQVFSGAREPADGFVPPSIPNYHTGACGELCTFNPQKAKELFDKSGYKGPITITSNADGGHKEWINAVCGNIRQVLGAECSFTPTPTFSEFSSKSSKFQQTGPFRFSWSADYPSAESFLAKIYYTGASSNYTKYSNKAFDAAIDKANMAPTKEEANKLYEEAEKILVQDMPSVPLFNQNGQAGHSDRISSVKLTPWRELDLASVKLNQ